MSARFNVNVNGDITKCGSISALSQIQSDVGFIPPNGGSILDYLYDLYEETKWNVNGNTLSPNIFVRYNRTGKVVTITIDPYATNDIPAADYIVKNEPLPSFLIPSADVSSIVSIRVNNTLTSGILKIDTAGNVTLTSDILNSVWPINTNQNGWDFGISISYLVA